MLKENRKTLIIASIVTLLPVVAGIIFWDRFPEKMATHFGMDGNPDGFSSRAFTVFAIPLILVAVEWLGAYVTSLDPKVKDISKKMVTMCFWIPPVVSLLLAGMVYPYNMGYRLDVLLIMGIFIGLMFVVIGNYMPKFRRNYVMGIRIPWTLESDDNWYRTHRLAGFLWVAAGAVILLLTLTGLMKVWMMAAVTVAAVLVPVVYSYATRDKK